MRFPSSDQTKLFTFFQHYRVLGILVLGSLMSCQSPSSSSQVAEVAEDSKAVGSAPVIRFEGLEGNEVAFTPAAQKWTVLHFWATWCKPCIAEFPELKKSLPRLDTDQVQFLVASDEDLDRIDAFQKKYTTGLDLIRMKEGSLADFEIYALPTTLVLDSTGKEVFRHAGQLKWAEISSIDELIAQQP